MISIIAWTAGTIALFAVVMLAAVRRGAKAGEKDRLAAEKAKEDAARAAEGKEEAGNG